MTTAYLTDTRYDAHTLPGHPECAERLQAIRARIAEHGRDTQMKAFSPEPISDAQILTVHTEDYLETVLKWGVTRGGIMLGSDTYLLPHSLELARLSAGAALRGVDAILSGEAHNGYAAARPPGHHAVPDMAMGFCLLANISLAARHAQAVYGLKRVLIVDYDVHHGNGTQAIFYDDPSVLFLSTHQSPWYPGTGGINETGEGAGAGQTINIPLPAGVGDQGFRMIYEEIVWGAARRFQPELILVSAGFDAHWRDPLGGLKLTVNGYAHLSRELIRMADELCGGRILFVQEGGYNLEALSFCALAVVEALLGLPLGVDPLGAEAKNDPDIRPLLTRVKAVHGL
ncbi:MAG TPA: histone deacetylase [Aggregatilineales bacterium]|nr:histone deacetylase [Anaerolineales bacterium]HRE48751.1 histone deacetylase [Aggregatilineales bacterium]